MKHLLVPIATWPLEDGREFVIWPRAEGRAALCLAFSPGARWYVDEWEYGSALLAMMAAMAFDPATEREPKGWQRHPATGRSREASVQ